MHATLFLLDPKQQTGIEPPRPAAPRFYRPELDSLRFLAFLLVYCCHALHGFTHLSRTGAFLQHAAAGSAFGVDLFFILSAYLITEILRREKHATGTVSIRDFYLRRILRIWPLYFAFLAACFLLRSLTPTRFPLAAFAAFLCFAGNWYMAYAATHTPFVSPVDPLWSISVEEQFYLIWPWVVRSAGRTGLLLSALALFVTSWLAQLVLFRAGAPHLVVWVNSLVHGDAIAVGILLSVVLAGRAPRIPALLRLGMVPAALALWGIADQFFHFSAAQPSTLQGMAAYALGLTGACLLFAAFLGAPQDHLPWLAHRALTLPGRISYGLYVFHVAVLEAVKYAALRWQGQCPPFTRFALAMPIVLLLAWASYRWLEEPVLRRKQRYTHIDSGLPALARDPHPQQPS